MKPTHGVFRTATDYRTHNQKMQFCNVCHPTFGVGSTSPCLYRTAWSRQSTSATKLQFVPSLSPARRLSSPWRYWRRAAPVAWTYRDGFARDLRIYCGLCIGLPRVTALFARPWRFSALVSRDLGTGGNRLELIQSASPTFLVRLCIGNASESCSRNFEETCGSILRPQPFL